MGIIRLPTIVSSATPPRESSLIHFPSNAKHALKALNSMLTLIHANVIAPLQDQSTPPVKFVNARASKFSLTTNANVQMTSHYGTVRSASRVLLIRHLSQRINNVMCVQKDIQ